jgi:hypothetical protein
VFAYGKRRAVQFPMVRERLNRRERHSPASKYAETHESPPQKQDEYKPTDRAADGSDDGVSGYAVAAIIGAGNNARHECMCLCATMSGGVWTHHLLSLPQTPGEDVVQWREGGGTQGESRTVGDSSDVGGVGACSRCQAGNSDADDAGLG